MKLLVILQIVFRAFHERITFGDKVIVNGEEDQWKANRFSVRVKPGLNDFGVVEVPAGQIR